MRHRQAHLSGIFVICGLLASGGAQAHRRHHHSVSRPTAREVRLAAHQLTLQMQLAGLRFDFRDDFPVVSRLKGRIQQFDPVVTPQARRVASRILLPLMERKATDIEAYMLQERLDFRDAHPTMGKTKYKLLAAQAQVALLRHVSRTE